MGSSFGGVDLFGDSPHRFEMGSMGPVVRTRLSLGTIAAGSVLIGAGEPTVTVRGRLVAATGLALMARIDAIAAELQPGGGGFVRQTLTDHHGRTWMDMTFVSFEPSGVIDRGREVSMEFAAVFHRLL